MADATSQRRKADRQWEDMKKSVAEAGKNKEVNPSRPIKLNGKEGAFLLRKPPESKTFQRRDTGTNFSCYTMWMLVYCEESEESNLGRSAALGKRLCDWGSRQ
eukprot:jgi/Mesvir1/26289/Mv01650-RA.1